MKELFYSDHTLQKDLEFCSHLDELRFNPDVLILRLPEECLIHEMEYVYLRGARHDTVPRRVDTGRTHIGFEYHYVRFAYKGLIFSLEASNYYPFTDENFPGTFNFVVYKRVGLTHDVQCTYSIAYNGLDSLDEWIKRRSSRINDLRPISCDVNAQPINIGVTKRVENILRAEVRESGGFREKTIMEHNPYVVATETWNNDHQVIRVIDDKVDCWGHRMSFEFDLVTKLICG